MLSEMGGCFACFSRVQMSLWGYPFSRSRSTILFSISLWNWGDVNFRARLMMFKAKFFFWW